MISFNELNLFSSGPTRLEPGAVQSRDAVADAPGTIGASVIGQGQAPRTIVQRGVLVGDTEADLFAQRDAIEARVGTAGTLVDEHGSAFTGCVLRRFEPGAPERLGPRYACRYVATYLQATP
ncbi:MAG: hypothetical protein ACE37H_10685 [Phycisphaeraceae bacterium]